MAIVDAELAERAGWSMEALAEAFLEGGARLLQIRAKNTASGRLLGATEAIVAQARAVGATVLVNDRADIARLSGADGVHVGQDDLSPREVRRILGERAPSFIVGLSTHTDEQLAAALEGPGRDEISYAAVGPLFGTTTKATGYDALGLDRVRGAARIAAAAGIPIVAIGGIRLETAADVIRAGATAVAVISDLLVTADPADRVRAYLERLTV